MREPAGDSRLMLTVCAMSATIMQALDTTIANVALPYMQGSLSASLDQIDWVLTSYIVAAAIATAPIGWLADRFGRKRLFIVTTAGFTAASALCGFAQNIEQIVLFRLLQGVFGAALVPLSQAVMLDAYPPQQRGSAMAIWGAGVMLGPIMGPTLGAWLTDNYNWRWVFFINLPIGVATVAGLSTFMRETKAASDRAFDRFGFLALAVGVGALQLMLDRGEQLDWLQSPEIVIEAIISAVGFYFFIAHLVTTDTPFISPELFRDRNFVAACFVMVVIGVVLFGTMALVTPFLQAVSGYPILLTGLLLASRGLGTLVAMMVGGNLLKFVEARWLILCGLILTAVTLFVTAGFTDRTDSTTIVIINISQGFGLGLVFVPLSAAAFATLPVRLRTEAASVLTLLRNIGSSAGISLVIARLTSATTATHARLAELVTPFNDALSMPDAASLLDMTTDSGRMIADQIVTQQAAIIAYDQDFQLLAYLTVATLPLALIIGSSKMRNAEGGASTAHAMD